MNIYITYERSFFTEKQIENLSKYAKLIFLESYFDLDSAEYLKDDAEKILMADPLNTEIRGKTVGIIGLGTIGTRIAELCSNLGMKVIYWSKNKKENSYQRVEVDEIFKKADYIIPTFATNDETRKLITDERIEMMSGNNLINIIINPVEIYNHNLVLEKVGKNEIGYAFEIYDDKTLNDFKGNVMATAPYSFYTKESIDRLVELWCNNTIGILNNNLQNVVK